MKPALIALPYFIDRKYRFHEPLYTLCTLLTMKPALTVIKVRRVETSTTVNKVCGELSTYSL